MAWSSSSTFCLLLVQQGAGGGWLERPAAPVHSCKQAGHLRQGCDELVMARDFREEAETPGISYLNISWELKVRFPFTGLRLHDR